MKNLEENNLGHWLAYLWSSIIEEAENYGLKHQPATLLPSKSPFMAYQLPAHHPAAFAELDELETMQGFGLENPDIMTVEIFDPSFEQLSSIDGDVELLDRPHIYN